MALDTYAALKAALPDWLLGRSAVDIVDRVDEFFAMAHQRIVFGSGDPGMECEGLRIRFMETSADLAISSDTVALPSDFLQGRRLYLNASPVILLTQTSPDQIYAEYPDRASTGRPKLVAIEGTNLIFGPTPDAAYTGKMLYFARPATPTADADTNWLMVNAPGVYLAGAAHYAWAFLEEADKALQHGAAFAGMMRALQSSNDRDRWAGAPAQVRLRGAWTP